MPRDLAHSTHRLRLTRCSVPSSCGKRHDNNRQRKLCEGNTPPAAKCYMRTPEAERVEGGCCSICKHAHRRKLPCAQARCETSGCCRRVYSALVSRGRSCAWRPAMQSAGNALVRTAPRPRFTDSPYFAARAAASRREFLVAAGEAAQALDGRIECALDDRDAYLRRAPPHHARAHLDREPVGGRHALPRRRVDQSRDPQRALRRLVGVGDRPKRIDRIEDRLDLATAGLAGRAAHEADPLVDVRLERFRAR
mmetsp:Transcript_56802/g.156112  ORF Transcript_56802/g.156112 Transcript_56802/m.156112 type:complete len:252 (-) Transcript_56802:503-1258(-)